MDKEPPYQPTLAEIPSTWVEDDPEDRRLQALKLAVRVTAPVDIVLESVDLEADSIVGRAKVFEDYLKGGSNG